MNVGNTVIVIEHNMDFILRRGVDRIIVMDQGKVLMQGTPDEVKEWFKEEGFDKMKLMVKSHFNSIPTSQVNMNGVKS